VKRRWLIVLLAAGMMPAALAQTLVPEGSTVTASPHDPLEVQLSSGSVCYLVTFEGGGHLNQIHPESGGLVPGTPIRFASNWLTIGSGPNANNTSVPTIAVYLGPTAQVTFEQPVAVVGFYFASSGDVTLQAFDAGGSLLWPARLALPTTSLVPDSRSGTS